MSTCLILRCFHSLHWQWAWHKFPMPLAPAGLLQHQHQIDAMMQCSSNFHSRVHLKSIKILWKPWFARVFCLVTWWKCVWSWECRLMLKWQEKVCCFGKHKVASSLRLGQLSESPKWHIEWHRAYIASCCINDRCCSTNKLPRYYFCHLCPWYRKKTYWQRL